MSPHAGRRSLRAHLLAATALIVVLSVGLTLAIGFVLTRRAAEHATQRGVSRQADLMAAREKISVAPLRFHLAALRRSVQVQNEKVQAAPLDGPSAYLSTTEAARVRRGEDVDGTLSLAGVDYFFSARRISPKTALVLLRPKASGATAARPFVQGLVIAAAAGTLLAALASVLLARFIARPARRVAEATRSLAAARTPEPVPIEGPSELASLAASFNEMAAQLQRAREAERSFLLSVSHELKTPLTAIRGYAEGLAEEAVPAPEAADTIRLEAARLERLVGDLLDLARMNRSEFSIEVAPIDLAQIARDTVRRYEGQARAFCVDLDAEADSEAPALADPDRALQIASNLVENALRVTPPGGSVRVSTEPGVLRVDDTGPGLRPDELPRAFERFFLYDRYLRSDRRVGTGLGLAIVKALAEGMNGSVEVRSEAGLGACFVVRLPRFTPALPAANAGLTEAGKHGSVSYAGGESA